MPNARLSGHAFRLVSGGIVPPGMPESVFTARCSCGQWVLVLTLDDAARLGLRSWRAALDYARREHAAHADARLDLVKRRAGTDFY